MCRHIATASAAAIPAPTFGRATAPISASANRVVTSGLLLVTMRRSPVFMRGLAQFSKFQTSSDLRDGLKTGALDAPLPLAQCSFAEPHSGAIPNPWTTIEVMNQSREFAIVARVPLTNIPCCRERAAKRLQTDCAPTALRLHSDCKKTAHRLQSDCGSTAQLDFNPGICIELIRSELSLQFLRNRALPHLVIGWTARPLESLNSPAPSDSVYTRYCCRIVLAAPRERGYDFISRWLCQPV